MSCVYFMAVFSVPPFAVFWSCDDQWLWNTLKFLIETWHIKYNDTSQNNVSSFGLRVIPKEIMGGSNSNCNANI